MITGKNGSMNSSVMAAIRSCLLCVCALLIFPTATSTRNCTVSQTETISSRQGLLTTINCHYSKNNSQLFQVSLRTGNTLCNYVYLNTSWSKQNCDDNIRFVWIPETEEMSFQLLNLQISNAGVYTCTVVNYIPPPTKCLGQNRIFIHVRAPPSVSVSCLKGSDGTPTVLCTSAYFYPDDLKQAWLKNGEYISNLNTTYRMLYKESLNSSHVRWNYSSNTDGTYSFTSYLHLPSTKVVYYCWVNHSTLSQPITVSSKMCTENKETLPDVFLSVAGISCGVIVSTGLILAVYCQHSRKRNYFQSPVEEPPLPEPVHHSTPGTLGDHQLVPHVYSTVGNPRPVPQVYSTLGNHQPVPCRITSTDAASL